MPTRPAFHAPQIARVLACLFFPPFLSVASAHWDSQLTTRALWNSNVSNSDRSADVIGALQFNADAVASRRIPLGTHDAIWAGAGLAAEATPRFDDLGRAAIGPRLTWQHKFGLGAFVPIFGLELTADAVAARDAARAGLAGSAALFCQQRLTPSTRVALTYNLARHAAREALFDRTGGEISGEITHDFDERWRLTGSLSLRQGDVLSYAVPPRADLVPLAKIRQPVSTFGSPRIAYSLAAQSLEGGVALAHRWKSASVVFSYHYRETERHPLRYLNHLVSVTWMHQF